MIRHWLPQENDTSSGSNLGHRRLISSLNQPRQVTQTHTHTHTHTRLHTHTPERQRLIIMRWRVWRPFGRRMALA